jgi:hypothetical protein
VGAEIVVSVDEADADPEQRDALCRALRAELLDLEVDDVRRVVSGDAPPGSRAPDVVAIGQLVVLIPASVQATASVVSTVRGWLGRGPESRTVELTIGEPRSASARRPAGSKTSSLPSFSNAVKEPQPTSEQRVRRTRTDVAYLLQHQDIPSSELTGIVQQQRILLAEDPANAAVAGWLRWGRFGTKCRS